MKNIKVSFHHTHHIYKFKLDLNVYENSNMLNIDPRKSMATFQGIVNKLIVTTEEKIIFQTLSLAFKDQFLKKYEKALQERKTIDFLGNTADQQLGYFQRCFEASQSFVSKIKQLYIFVTRNGDDLHKFKQVANKPRMYKLIYKFACQFQNSGQQNKANSYIFYYCLLSNILHLLMNHVLAENDKQEVIDYANKNVLLALDKILYHYEYSYLSAIFELAMQIWTLCLKNSKNHGWLYKKHEDDLINTSILRLLTETIKVENKNFIIQASIIKFLLQVLEKCDGVNQLLLFITECINLRITIRLDYLLQAVNMLKFSRQNSVYLNLPKDLTEDMGKKVIRMKEKGINQQNWNTQITICKLKLKQLIQRFVKFKHGKIETKKPKQVPYRSERQRIRKESFIETNFQEIKHKYQEALLHEDHHSQNYKILHENKELLQMNKSYQQKIKEKQAIIAELELAVAQFVDVRQKYVRQNILKVQSKVNQYKIQHHGIYKIEEHLMDSKRKSVDKYKQIFYNKPEISSSLSIPPPPPPPPFEKPNSLRGSRKSNQVHILPPPPSLNLGLPQLLLPPPPPLIGITLPNIPNLPPPPTIPNLTNLPNIPLPPPPSISLTASPLSKTTNKEKKDVKMINWTTVQISKVKDSFWESVEEVEVNEKQLISFFAKKQDITAQAPKIVIAPQRQKKSLLRPERAKNIQIILKKTRISIPQIPLAIEQLDEEVLTSTNADNLLNALPNAQQTDMFIQLLINDPEQWSNADLYFCLITKIHGYAEILKAIKFKAQFQWIAEKYNEKLNEFEAFFIELEKDIFFQTFLSYLLSVGNFMNSDTSKGNAYGFKLESIEKSYTLMGQDKKTSLFQYIMKMMVKKQVIFPEKSYYKNKRITPIQVLKDDLKQLTKDCRNIQECLLMSNQDDMRTPQYFLSFYIQCRQKVSLMDVKYSDCVKVFNKVCQFYCQKLQSEKIAKIVNELRDRVYKYIEKNKIQIKK